MGFALDWMGRELARYLSAPGRRSTQIAIDPPEAVAEALRPGESRGNLNVLIEADVWKDLKNVFDLARYLFPVPPVPSRLRRRLIALGSGDPTRAICSTVIA